MDDWLEGCQKKKKKTDAKRKQPSSLFTCLVNNHCLQAREASLEGGEGEREREITR